MQEGTDLMLLSNVLAYYGTLLDKTEDELNNILHELGEPVYDDSRDELYEIESISELKLALARLGDVENKVQFIDIDNSRYSVQIKNGDGIIKNTKTSNRIYATSVLGRRIMDKVDYDKL